MTAESTPGRGVTSRVSTGAASELIACAELIRRGYYVYRCESPSAPFDLVAYRDAQCLRVEVKTITFHETKTYAPNFATPANDEWDLLVVVGKAADVFIFEGGTDVRDARNAIRTHFGYRTIGEPVPCGTYLAYRRHVRLDEEPCLPCREANRQRRGKREAELLGRRPIAAALSGGCDCGHDGLDEMFHLLPCPIAQLRVVRRLSNAPEPIPSPMRRYADPSTPLSAPVIDINQRADEHTEVCR